MAYLRMREAGKNVKKWSQAAACFASAVLTAAGVFCVAARIPQGAAEKAATVAAEFIIPAGNTDGFFSEEHEEGDGSSCSPKSAPSSHAVSSGASSGTKAIPSSGQSVSSSVSGKVLELTIGNGGVEVNSMWIKNSTERHTSVNFSEELNKAPAVKIKMNSTSPQVLIYHTHTTESYEPTSRTTDRTKSVCAVGEKIAGQLRSAGINTFHDTTYHDYPAYNGSYDRSKATMEKDLKKYPGIQVTLDIHRDAMHRSDGTALKPTVIIGGKKAAQLMVLAGCDDDGSLGFPNWECNLRLALRLQQMLSGQYSSLARPLDFCARKYNENMTKGSLLVEIGTDGNTLDEAEYTGELFGKSLAEVLKSLS
jgi:stage II sporulation protein P